MPWSWSWREHGRTSWSVCMHDTVHVCVYQVYTYVHTPTIHIDMDTGINSIAGVYFTDTCTLYYSNDM